MLTYHSPVYFQVHDLETTPLWPLIPQPPRSSSWPSVAQALSTQTHLNVCLMKTSCMKTLQEQDSTSETKVLHKTIIIYHRIFLLIGWIQKQPNIGQTEACLNTSIYTVSFQAKPDIEGGLWKSFSFQLFPYGCYYFTQITTKNSNWTILFLYESMRFWHYYSLQIEIILNLSMEKNLQ